MLAVKGRYFRDNVVNSYLERLLKLLKSAQFSLPDVVVVVVVDSTASVFVVAGSSNLAQLAEGSVVDDGCWLSQGEAVSMATGTAHELPDSGHSVRKQIPLTQTVFSRILSV